MFLHSEKNYLSEAASLKNFTKYCTFITKVSSEKALKHDIRAFRKVFIKIRGLTPRKYKARFFMAQKIAIMPFEWSQFY